MAGKLLFDPEMRKILAQMKGKTFKSYECARERRGDSVCADGNVRINLGQYSVELTCYNALFDVDGETVEMTSLACKTVDLGEPFTPYIVRPSHAYMVNERITGVELVSDHVEVRGSREMFDLDIDMAVAIKTNRGVYTFAREIWFSSGIDINIANDIVVPYTVEKCNNDWTDDPAEGDAIAKTTRSTVQLA